MLYCCKYVPCNLKMSISHSCWKKSFNTQDVENLVNTGGINYTYSLMPKISKFGSSPFPGVSNCCYYSCHFVICLVDQPMKTASPIGSPHMPQKLQLLHISSADLSEGMILFCTATSNFLKCWANSGRESLILNKLKWVKPLNDIVKTTFLTHHLGWYIDHQWPSH